MVLVRHVHVECPICGSRRVTVNPDGWFVCTKCQYAWHDFEAMLREVGLL